MPINTELQEHEFRKVCDLFGDYFSEKEVSSAIEIARDFEPNYLTRMIFGAKALQITDPYYFQIEVNNKTAQVYEKGLVLLSMANYRPGDNNARTILNTIQNVEKRIDGTSNVEDLIHQRSGSGNFDPERDIVFDKQIL